MSSCLPACGSGLFRFRRVLCSLLLVLAGAPAGCSSEEPNGPPSVQESLAELQRTASQFKTQPAPPPTTPAAAPLENEVHPLTTGTYKVKFETSAGDFLIVVHRDWAPIGAERFHQLVRSGFFDDCRFFRVLPGFMAQFGIHGNPATQRQWERNINDDPVTQSNKKGYVTFATAGPNTRTTQVFINYADNRFLDAQGFSPFGEVVEGMSSVEDIDSKYGETPDQGQINLKGNEYLNESFPELDYIKKATIVEEESK